MGDQPVHEMSREVQRLLVVAKDSGEPASEALLQEECGLGHDDLHGVLDQLREHGMAEEVAPGEWQAPSDRVPARALEVEVPDEPDDRVEAARAAMRERDEMSSEVQRLLGSRAGGSSFAGAPTVRLTTAIANALDAEALGKLVKAGIDEATAHDQPFTLEVAP